MNDARLAVPASLVACLLLLGVCLTLTVVPGVFIIDEDNYLVTLIGLRQGRLTVPGTAGLSATPELLYFDPAPRMRRVAATPVSSTAPPLYAFLALPFALGSWRGLVALNTLAFLVTIALVFVYARHVNTNPTTPWLAATAFAIGGYAIEYAQGMWPQMLSVGLCTGATLAVATSRRTGSAGAAMLAGLLVGLATGIRYQNAVFVLALAAGLWFWSPSKWRNTGAFGIAVLAPLILCAVINQSRLGSWNPISKGAGYLSTSAGRSGNGFLWDLGVMFWALVVDFSVRPPLTSIDHLTYLWRDPATGAYLIDGALKKAWLQSAPWQLVSLVAMSVAWLPGCRCQGAVRRELRALSLIVFAVLLTFVAAGPSRTDGLAYNQRYFLELLPLTALALAWALDDFELSPRSLVIGAIAGIGLALLILVRPPESTARQLVLMRLPLLLAVLVAGLWLTARRDRADTMLGATLGICLAWGLAVHLGEDVPASRRLREINRVRLQLMDRVIADRSALFAYWGNKDAAGPLQLDRDVVILDAWTDQLETMPKLVDELLHGGRRVFVLTKDFPPVALSDALGEHVVQPVMQDALEIIEVRPKAAP